MMCTPISTPPSWLSLLSCGTQVLSDLRNLTACGRIDAFLVRITMPERMLLVHVELTAYIADAGRENEESNLSGLVLGDLVLSVLFAGLALAVSAACLRNVDLEERVC